MIQTRYRMEILIYTWEEEVSTPKPKEARELIDVERDLEKDRRVVSRKNRTCCK